MRYTLTRLLYLVFIVLAVTFLVSTMLSLMPGDPAHAILGELAPPEQVAALHHQLHLDQPVLERYFRWLGNAVQGDLGRSVRGEVPVLDAITQRAPVTIELVLGAQLVALLLAVPAAIFAAYRPGKLVDKSSTFVAFALISIPNFVLGLAFVLLFSVRLHWFPVAGFVPFTEDPVQHLRTMVLPVMVVAAGPAGVYYRLLRNDMRTTLGEDYIAMAEAKGQSTLRILLRHALRPSLVSLVTVVGLTMATAVGGSVVSEIIFGLPGLGRLLIDSIQVRDVVVVQGVVAVIAIGYVVINGFVDILYGVIDPRVRQREV